MSEPNATRNRRVSLRKSPKQNRSKDLVEAVMGAAARILESAGAESLTTNKVAQLAGVSIGSLYQYFPGKDAIFAQLIESELERHHARYRVFVAEHATDDPREIVRILMDDLVQLFYERRKFIATLFSEVPKLKKTREVLYKRNRLAQVFAELMRTRPEVLREPATIDQQIYAMSHAVIGVLQTAVLEDFENSSPEVLKRELTEMVSRYLLV